MVVTAGVGSAMIGDDMRRLVLGLRNSMIRCIAVPGAALLIGIGAAIAQSGDLRAQDQQKSAPPATNPAGQQTDPARDSQRKVNEFQEASQAITGPAGHPECVWLGRRVVVLMWRDDLDTAFRHLDLYERFGCPGGHIQAAFRCLVRFGAIDPKVPESLSGRVHACWINTNAQPQEAAAAGPNSPAQPAQAPAVPAPAQPQAAPTGNSGPPK